MNMKLNLFPLIISMETPGRIAVNFQSHLQSHFFRSSQHGVFISWLQRLPLRYFLPLSVSISCAVWSFFFQIASWDLYFVDCIRTGGIHIQLLGDSSFEFPPWSPGKTYSWTLYALSSTVTAYWLFVCLCIIEWLHHFGLQEMTKGI